jgi:hypothetical protein
MRAWRATACHLALLGDRIRKWECGIRKWEK